MRSIPPLSRSRIKAETLSLALGFARFSMSSVYTLEPPTRGSLTLRTTHGPISVGLWADESPRAVQSVVQHALNSYYDGLAFHRVVPDVLIQGGDPSGTGSGGVHAFPGPLRRESHGRLKFRRRGLVALVADEDGLCGSQFFITLAETPWLNGMHTIFGTVIGDTIFNALALAEAAKGAEEPPKILGFDVVDNPFPEIVRNVKPKIELEKQRKEDPLRKVAVRDKHRLSFALQDDEEDDSDEGGRPPPRKKTLFASSRSKSALQAPPPKPTPASQSAAANGMVDKAAAARAEFDRLRAAMLRGAAKKGTASQKRGATAPGNAPPSAQSERSAADLVPAAKNGKLSARRDAIAVPRGRRCGNSGTQEADVLRKLAGFEKRLRAARDSGSRKLAGNDNEDSWFARPLTLPGAHDERVLREDADEYDAREGLPQLMPGARSGRAGRGKWNERRERGGRSSR